MRGDDGMGFLLKYENVAWYDHGLVKILDRRIYPVRTEYVTCKTYQDVAQAIHDMVTQSAGPYTAAAMGMVLAQYQCKDKDHTETIEFLTKAAFDLSHARPTTSAEMQKITKTALDTALKSMQQGDSWEQTVKKLQEYAMNRINNNYIKFQSIGSLLADRIPDQGTVMTQCFAETILGTLGNALKKEGKSVSFLCPETRPYFQGSRLTASVLSDMGFDVTVLSDNMIGAALQNKKIDVFTSAADVIAMDGTIVNKVGTFQIATLMKEFGIPYYVTGEPNKNHPTGDSIIIEERDPELVCSSMGIKLTKDGVKGYYPAFDKTPANLVTEIITDRGAFRPDECERYFESE